jgi:hypothetical protein
MNLVLHVPPNLEVTLKAQASAAGKDLAAFVVETLQQALAPEASGVAVTESHEQFRTKLQQIIDLHPRGNSAMDDSRESIYAGRGE